MELWPVGKAVGSPKNIGPDLIKRVKIAAPKSPTLL
jgi:hypothetical protein